MKKKLAILLIGCLAMVLMAGCGESEEQQNTPEIYVFAASSLTDCLNEIITLYESEYNHQVVAVYEGSGTLKKQIAEGADCDI